MTVDVIIDAEVVDETSLPVLASAANRCHAEVEASGQTMLEAAWNAGQALLAAKAQVNHGEWKPWLADNFTGSYRTAATYMSMATKVQRAALLDSDQSLRGALKAIRQRQEPKPEPPSVPGRRRPLSDQANTAGWELRKSVERVERIINDDRFPQQREKVASAMRSHLITAITVCQDALDRINTEKESS